MSSHLEGQEPQAVDIYDIDTIYTLIEGQNTRVNIVVAPWAPLSLVDSL